MNKIKDPLTPKERRLAWQKAEELLEHLREKRERNYNWIDRLHIESSRKCG